MIRRGQFEEETRQKIIAERKSRGWPQRMIVAKLAQYGWRVPLQYVSAMECGHKPITVDDLVALSFVFDIPASKLLP